MRLRREEKEAKRAALLRAGLELIRRQGFARTSVDEITARAGVAKGAFYSYFATKEDLVLAAVAETQAGGADRLQALLSAPLSTRERMVVIFSAALQWMQENGELIWIYCVERLRPGRDRAGEGYRSWFGRTLTRVFTAGQEAGDVRRDRPAAHLALDLEGILLAHIAAWYHQEAEGSLAESVFPAIHTYLDGACMTPMDGKTVQGE